MVRESKRIPLTYGENGVTYIEASGLSTDDKPVEGIATGSLFLEIDTGDVYARNEDGDTGSEWLKVASLGGSGS